MSWQASQANKQTYTQTCRGQDSCELPLTTKKIKNTALQDGDVYQSRCLRMSVNLPPAGALT